MNEKKIIVTGSLFLISFLFVNVSVFAETMSQKTVGEVIFEADQNKKGGEPIVPGPGPGEKPEIYPVEPDGNNTDGPLRIEYVPASLNFGTQKIVSKTEHYNIRWGTGRVGTDKTDVKIPPFAQVTDERGIRGSWQLELSQENIFSPKDDKNSFLDGLMDTRIELHSSQLFNGHVPDATTLVEGVAGLTEGSSVDVPIGWEGNKIRILATKAGQNTDNSISSVVFASAKDYDNDTTFYEAAKQHTLGESHGGIQLRVPGKDQKEDQTTYTANLIWSLTNSI